MGKTRNKPNYISYISKIAKKNTGAGISLPAAQQMNLIVEHLLERMVTTSSSIAKAAGKNTLHHKHMIAAAKMELPVEMIEDAITYANAAADRSVEHLNLVEKDDEITEKTEV
tara:strand:- start:349 stop:687 length:339 start_codon:yes stop_codon:yes gene_type:complete